MKCPFCGAEMVRVPDKILTSMPPKYEYKCPKCGCVSYQTADVLDTDGLSGVRSSFVELPDPWFEFRCEVAGRMFAAAYSHRGSFVNPHAVARQSIGYADILIEELKNKNNLSH